MQNKKLRPPTSKKRGQSLWSNTVYLQMGCIAGHPALNWFYPPTVSNHYVTMWVLPISHVTGATHAQHSVLLSRTSSIMLYSAANKVPVNCHSQSANVCVCPYVHIYMSIIPVCWWYGWRGGEIISSPPAETLWGTPGPQHHQPHQEDDVVMMSSTGRRRGWPGMLVGTGARVSEPGDCSLSGGCWGQRMDNNILWANQWLERLHFMCLHQYTMSTSVRPLTPYAPGFVREMVFENFCSTAPLCSSMPCIRLCTSDMMQ